jgi:hypothetical protein
MAVPENSLSVLIWSSWHGLIAQQRGTGARVLVGVVEATIPVLIDLATLEVVVADLAPEHDRLVVEVVMPDNALVSHAAHRAIPPTGAAPRQTR